MQPPVVQDLNALVAKYTAAMKPQSDVLDTSIDSNTQSGTAQTAGIEAKKTAAFGGITTAANAHGQDFTGFTPDAEAKYTGATYLPALATLQSTIDNTRNNLLGKKADLATQANTSAINEQSNEQKDLQAYNERAAAAAADAEAERQKEAFQASENAKDRAASAANARASAAAKAPSASDRQNAFNGQLGSLFQGYNPKTDKFYTEKVVIPSLLNAGYDPSTVAKQVYAYRKSAFGE